MSTDEAAFATLLDSAKQYATVVNGNLNKKIKEFNALKIQLDKKEAELNAVKIQLDKKEAELMAVKKQLEERTADKNKLSVQHDRSVKQNLELAKKCVYLNNLLDEEKKKSQESEEYVKKRKERDGERQSSILSMFNKAQKMEDNLGHVIKYVKKVHKQASELRQEALKNIETADEDKKKTEDNQDADTMFSPLNVKTGAKPSEMFSPIDEGIDDEAMSQLVNEIETSAKKKKASPRPDTPLTNSSVKQKLDKLFQVTEKEAEKEEENEIIEVNDSDSSDNSSN
jgi:hypothetical protein